MVSKSIEKVIEAMEAEEASWYEEGACCWLDGSEEREDELFELCLMKS